MIFRAMTIGAVTIALASCALSPRQPSVPASVSTQAVQIWEYPAGEFPTMCIVMSAGGVVNFRGGFTFFNPGAWRPGSKPGGLVITLGGDTPFPKKAAEQDLRVPESTLVRFDAARRELEFVLRGHKMERIAIGGFYFYRTATCGAG